MRIGVPLLAFAMGLAASTAKVTIETARVNLIVGQTEENLKAVEGS